MDRGGAGGGRGAQAGVHTLPGGPAVKILIFPGRGPRFNHWSGTKIQDAAWCRQTSCGGGASAKALR